MAISATITVEWGYELHSITLRAKHWRRVKSGKSLRIRGKGYRCDDGFFWDYWNFGGGNEGSLIVEYGDDGGVGFNGRLKDVTIFEHTEVRRQPRRYIVKAVASSPVWTGTLWGVGCEKLSSAERLFERRSTEVDTLSALLLVDRLEGKVMKSVGTNDPVATARAFGEEITP